MKHSKLFKKVAIYCGLYVVTLFIIVSAFLFDSTSNDRFPVLRLVIIVFASVLLVKYFIYMLLSPWHDVRRQTHLLRYREKLKNFNPRVSVLVPAWNEEIGILATIKSLLASTYTNTEVVIVNDGSTDNSDAIIRRFIKKHKSSARARGGAERLILYTNTKKTAERAVL